MTSPTPSFTPSFSEPFRVGNAFGPGSAVVTCLSCGALVLDRTRERELHSAWHTDPASVLPRSTGETGTAAAPSQPG